VEQDDNLAMALHRDIYWVGRQWAVTGYGIQACDQKQKGQFDIEGSRLWEAGVQESLRGQKWINSEDFEKAVSVARKYFPEPPREAQPAEASIRPPEPDAVSPEPSKPAVPAVSLRGAGVRARLIPVWRVRSHLSVRRDNP
jgi:hypothetical protein